VSTKRTQGSASIVLTVGGYKSIADPLELTLKPLTIIAGANSSGKSSFLQPFLLLKQTIDASFDAGPLLLHGPNVRLTKWEQAINRGKNRTRARLNLEIGLMIEDKGFHNRYAWDSAKGIRLVETTYRGTPQTTAETPFGGTPAATYNRNMNSAAIEATFDKTLRDFTRAFYSRTKTKQDVLFVIEERRGFLEPELRIRRGSSGPQVLSIATLTDGYSTKFVEFISSIMHVPGLRGNPERSYLSSSVGGTFPGTMDQYVASMIDTWQRGSTAQKAKLHSVADDLEQLGLTWKVAAQRIDDIQIELLVGRLPHAQQGGAQDLVNIADVGFGVSQTLPVVVALHAARPQQIVYIEQPEIHLHPRAQGAIAQSMVAAARRGVFVVAETHSSLIIRAAQTAIARGDIDESLVAFNWFSRDEKTGFTKIDSADLDAQGRFGDWPIDFDEVVEQADWDYLMSAQSEL
jgi:predicted ATPase